LRPTDAGRLDGLIFAAFYVAAGWVFTALACPVYNLAARWVGGVTIQVEVEGPMDQPPAPESNRRR
jgi:hypothetical protein